MEPIVVLRSHSAFAAKVVLSPYRARCELHVMRVCSHTVTRYLRSAAWDLQRHCSLRAVVDWTPWLWVYLAVNFTSLWHLAQQEQHSIARVQKHPGGGGGEFY